MDICCHRHISFRINRHPPSDEDFILSYTLHIELPLRGKGLPCNPCCAAPFGTYLHFYFFGTVNPKL